MSESVVEINGHLYRYEYVAGATVYKGPVGDAPPIDEQVFEEFMRERWTPPKTFKEDMKEYFAQKGILARHEELPPPGTRYELTPVTIGEHGYSAIMLDFPDKKPENLSERIHWDWVEIEVGDRLDIGDQQIWIEGRTEARKWMKRYAKDMGWKEAKK
jgi:hypothetical protein